MQPPKSPGAICQHDITIYAARTPSCRNNCQRNWSRSPKNRRDHHPRGLPLHQRLECGKMVEVWLAYRRQVVNQTNQHRQSQRYRRQNLTRSRMWCPTGIGSGRSPTSRDPVAKSTYVKRLSRRMGFPPSSLDLATIQESTCRQKYILLATISRSQITIGAKVTPRATTASVDVTEIGATVARPRSVATCGLIMSSMLSSVRALESKQRSWIQAKRWMDSLPWLRIL